MKTSNPAAIRHAIALVLACLAVMVVAGPADAQGKTATGQVDVSLRAASLPGPTYAWVAMPAQLTAESDRRVQDPQLRGIAHLGRVPRQHLSSLVGTLRHAVPLGDSQVVLWLKRALEALQRRVDGAGRHLGTPPILRLDDHGAVVERVVEALARCRIFRTCRVQERGPS